MPDFGKLTEEQQARLTRRLIRQQAGLSLRVASAFVVLLIALPLANLYAPAVMNSRALGFTLTWLLLGVIFFPLTWFLSVVFVKKTDEIEAEEAKWKPDGGAAE